MPGEGLLFLFGVIMAALLLFMMVFFVIMFSDLECDYINPIDLCNKLNQVRVSNKLPRNKVSTGYAKLSLSSRKGRQIMEWANCEFVLPEMGAQAFLFLMFLLNGSWIAALINLPLVAFNVQKNIYGFCVSSPMLVRITNNRHMYDATEIFRTLSQHKKECFIKLAFYLLRELHVHTHVIPHRQCFFFYLYRMIVALIADA
ncbi:cornichon [Jimgerdemannia flammicorona]|uniref:Cornichon n=1 Tax=Jimgerdemannia flammicorona TaxID=994334 RepID=A0A433CXB5_9FUNG|nr:cornichon [Jimgerdemannia flammicorona]